MKEGTPLSKHLNEFNKIIIDLKNIDIEIYDEDQTLTVLCSLSDFFNNFINLMLYDRDTISLADVKFALNFIKLRTRLDEKGSDDQVEDLFINGHLENSRILEVDLVTQVKVTESQG